MKNITLLAIICFFSTVGFAQPQPPQPPAYVKIYTSEGVVKVMLYGETPQHRFNFLMLAKHKKLEGLLFHRVIKNFMIQGGDPESLDADTSKVLGGKSIGNPIDAEIVFPKLYHKRGALAAARTSDDVNPEKKSSGSQFYIVTGRTYSEDELDECEKVINNYLLPKELFKYSNQQRQTYKTFGGAAHLDGKYTVFGEVIDGFEVLEKIQKLAVDSNYRPKKDVVILKMKIVKK